MPCFHPIAAPGTHPNLSSAGQIVLGGTAGASRASKHPSMDWFKGKFTGKPHFLWENLWFPVKFPLNQSNQSRIR